MKILFNRPLSLNIPEKNYSMKRSKREGQGKIHGFQFSKKDLNFDAFWHRVTVKKKNALRASNTGNNFKYFQ